MHTAWICILAEATTIWLSTVEEIFIATRCVDALKSLLDAVTLHTLNAPASSVILKQSAW